MSLSTSVPISIPWEVADKLRQLAQARGITPNRLAASIVREAMESPDADTVPRDRLYPVREET